MKIGLNSISIWFGLIMILLLLGGAIAISFTDFLSERLYGTKRTFFVFLILAYSIYRGFRLYSMYKQNMREE